jgi:hypothetical protein
MKKKKNRKDILSFICYVSIILIIIEGIIVYKTGADASTVLGNIMTNIIIWPIIIFCMLYFVCAKHHIIVTFGKENAAIAVMRGGTMKDSVSKGGAFSGKIILSSNTMYDDSNHQIQLLTDQQKELKEESFLGLYYVGLWPFRQTYWRRQIWQERTLVKYIDRQTGEEKTKEVIWLRDEPTPFLFCAPFMYTSIIEEAEGNDNQPLNVDYDFIVIPTETEKPLFGADDMFEQLKSIIKKEALLFIKNENFKTIGGKNKDVNNTELRDRFSEQIISLNTLIPGRPDRLGSIDALGYKILGVNLGNVAIAGENAKILVEASTKPLIAEQEALAKNIGTDAEVYRIKETAKAESELGQVYERNPKLAEIKRAEKKYGGTVTTLIEGNEKATPGIWLNK